MNSESRQTVQYFCTMDPTALGVLAARVPLSYLLPHLPRVQHYYRTQEHRDPCYFELRLLEALAANADRSPNAVRVSSLTASEELLRIFRDACHKWEVLGEHTPPSLYDLLGISGRYLSRAGITPHYTALRAAPHAQYALTPSTDGALTLSLTGATATLSPATMPPLPKCGALLLFSPTENACAAYTDLLTVHKELVPVAAVGSEGVLPHLLATDGATLDLTPFMDETASEIPPSLGAHTLLLAAPEQALPTLFAKGLPLALLGTLNQTKKLTFLYRGGTLTAPSLPFLRMLRTERAQNATEYVKSAPSVPTTPRITENEHTLLGGIDTCTDSENSVLTLATALVRRGAMLEESSLSAVLECPTHATPSSVGAALSLILGFHRAACELTLPTAHSALLATDVDVPRLSLFLATKKGEARLIQSPTSWQEARDIFYNN